MATAIELGEETVRASGNLIRSGLSLVGNRLPFTPGGKPPIEIAWKSLERRFGLIPAPLESPTDEALEGGVLPAAHTVGKDGIIDRATAIEVRLMAPAEDLDDSFYGRAAKVVEPVVQTLKEEHDIVVPNMHPIMPSERNDSPVDLAKVLATFSYELTLLQHQLDQEKGQRHEAALLAVSEPDYAARVFGPHLLLGREPLAHSQPVVMTPVGEEQTDYVLAPPVMH